MIFKKKNINEKLIEFKEIFVLDEIIYKNFISKFIKKQLNWLKYTTQIVDTILHFLITKFFTRRLEILSI
jgi:hypothetical protein